LRDLLDPLEDLDLVHSVTGSLDRLVHHVTRDSREVGSGSVFAAIVGANVDGHAFVPQLQAAVALVERPVQAQPGTTVIQVRSTRQALAWCASALHHFPGRAMRVIGVTGTNGKTTTTTVIEEALHREGVMVGRIGTTGNAIALSPRPTSFTTPEAPQLQALLAEMREAGCQAVAMEASSVGLAQHRVDGIPFHVGVFTNFTRDHLLEHGTMEAYHAAKERLFRELLRPAGGPPRSILCADDPEHLHMGAPADRWTYGFSEGADLRIVKMTLGLGGTHLVLHTPDGVVEMHSPLVGRHNALNLTAAYGVLRTLDLPSERAAAAVGSVLGVPGRLERVQDPAGRLVLVDYAHTDDALLNVLPTVRELTRGTLWVLFGCGGDRDRGKRPKMGEVAHRLADRVVITSDNPRSEDPTRIVDEILAGIADRSAVHVELDRETAIRWVLQQAQPGDAVLLAGKGHETYQEIAGVRRPFDDREVARVAMREL
jgi:UDP-N-acetylmuramoyl-L-alanyl-D-glutamate--2,6-diaminopimelate ligase